jgi:hypothetical protein
MDLAIGRRPRNVMAESAGKSKYGYVLRARAGSVT